MTEITQETLFSSNTHAENEQLSILKRHFPNCFDKQGAFLPEKMAEALQSSGIKTEKESYSLNWLGKSYAKILKDRQPETLLAEDIEHNQKPENQNSENILIQGDNLEVLKHLKYAYKNQIKMIYIDPPYNTGSDGFVYQDDRKFTPQQLVELGMDLEEAERVLEFTAKKSNSHSAWLTFMYPRLYIARELLRDDGVIFISIDDNEQAQLKLLCDEVFGEENFVEVFSWVKTSTPPSLSTKSRKTNEYILCYEKCKDNYKYNAGQQDEGDEPLLNSGNTERVLEFPSDSLTFNFIENGHLKAGKFDKVTLMNDIQIVNFKSTTPVLLSGEFKWVQDTLTEEIKKGTTFVAKTIKLSIRFLRTEKGFKRPTNFIKDEIITPLIDKKDTNVDTNEKATQEILIYLQNQCLQTLNHLA
jgi:type III restriction-modification system ecoP15I enzyme mod